MIFLLGKQGELFAGSLGFDYALLEQELSKTRLVPSVERVGLEALKHLLGLVILLR